MVQFRRYIIALITLSTSGMAWAQVANEEVDKDVKPGDSSEYIAQIPELLTFKIGLHNDVTGFASYNANQVVDIRPNTSTFLKLGASYRFVTMSYAFAAGFLPGNGDEDLKGKTTTSTYAMEFFLPRLFQSMYYTKTKGYYLYNTDDYIPGWIRNTDPFVQFPDLLHKGFGGVTGFRLNSNFSFPAIYSQTERQIKSAGTFVTNLKYDYYIINDRTQLNGTNSSQKSNNLLVALDPGYFYTFVFLKDFYFTLGVFGEIGLVHTKLTTRLPIAFPNPTYEYVNYESKNNDFLYGVEAQSALGYNGKRFFTGVVAKFYYNQHRQENTSQYLVKDRLIVDFTIGYRFTAPAFLVRHFDKREAQQKEKLQQLKMIFKKEN